jgi:alpha,alpha-trehalase
MTEWHIQTEGPLFMAVQSARIFPDGKTFVDCTPKADPQMIEARFAALLAQFVHDHFDVPTAPAPESTSTSAQPKRALEPHIDALWEQLGRPPDAGEPPSSTRIPLRFPYVVPGGRFREIYYWDSYFTLLGLLESGRTDLAEGMVANFADLIARFGHIPNGSRSYFLSRSQPPFFGLMLAALGGVRGAEAVRRYLPALEDEYRFWMDAPEGPQSQPAEQRRVRLADGALLNRYWDARNTPREEAYAQDIDVHARATPQRQAEIYRELRAGAESGWDYSSRFLGADGDLTRIHTTEIIPVDLNALLCQVERMLAEWRDQPAYRDAASRRQADLIQRCWDAQAGWFFDFDWKANQRTPIWSLAGAFPLFCELADQQQADAAARTLEEKFLQPGGLVTSLHPTGQQWDWPNGWAPLQWIAVQGLRKYGHERLAREIAARFVGLVEAVYQRTGKLMEKYDVYDLTKEAGGGEYPNQDGFGWTNGVVKALLGVYPGLRR